MALMVYSTQRELLPLREILAITTAVEKFSPVTVAMESAGLNRVATVTPANPFQLKTATAPARNQKWPHRLSSPPGPGESSRIKNS